VGNCKPQTALTIRCSRCDRYGRVRLAKLIEEHGADMPGPELAVLLANGCPKENVPWGERCWVYFPQLVELFTSGAREVPSSNYSS
jgi:hypothetical protein